MHEDELDDVLRYEDSVWCDLSRGADAFEANDYTSAIEYYEQALIRSAGQIRQYAVARLALSYALDDQIDQAQSNLNSIDPEGQMGDLLIALQAVSTEPTLMCRTAYTFFAEINSIGGQEYPYEIAYTFGGESSGVTGHFPAYPRPFQAGCNYLQFREFAPLPMPTQANQTAYLNSTWYFVRNDSFGFLRSGQYDEMLTIINNFLITETDNPNYADSLRYLRALTLEALDRPDEALAQYLALVESAPESAWGMLAALHITDAN